jgi:hypothetical protein
MTQPREGITQNVAERLCWEGARRDATRIARRLSRQPVVDGVDRLDDGALLDDFFPFLQAIGVMELLEEAHGAAIPRAMVPFVPSVLLDGVKTWFGIERIKALPNLLCSEAALMPLGGGARPPRSARGSASEGRASGRVSALRGRWARTPWL